MPGKKQELRKTCWQNFQVSLKQPLADMKMAGKSLLRKTDALKLQIEFRLVRILKPTKQK